MLELVNAENKVIASKSDRIGEKWEWWPAAKKLSDNNLNPGEERSFVLKQTLKSSQSLTLRTKVTKHRLNQESATYNKLDSSYPLSITVFEKEEKLVVK